MSYYLAPSLVDLRNEINAAYPDRDKASDGWIGDPSHQARVSDHNPDYADGGVVRAIDIDEDGIDTTKLLKILKGDSRVNYIIYEGLIYGASQFKARKYTGANAHTKHIHVSIKHTKAAESGGAWGYSAGAVKPVANKPKPTTSKPSPSKCDNSKSDYVAIANALNAMGLKAGYPDGVNGPMLKGAVKAYQKHHGLVADGNWGPVTQAKFEQVRNVQRALKKEGYTKQVVDGYDGAQTTANIKDYQKRVGLVADGVAGPKTLKKLGVK